MKIVSMLLVLCLLATPVMSQNTSPEADLKAEIAALQEQISALIRGRGEDQKALADLKGQLNRQRDPEQGKVNKEARKKFCKDTFDMELDSVSAVQTPGGTQVTTVCK